MMQQFHTQEYPAANRNYKDRLFRFVFKNKKDLLDLYNAINGTDYDIQKNWKSTPWKMCCTFP